MPASHVLVVEDYQPIGRAIMAFLQKAGHDVKLALTVREGMEHLEWAGCVILDLRLSDGNGKQILERVRQDHPQVRVAIHSSLPRDAIDDVLELSPDAVFAKPVEPSELVAWVAQC